MAYAATAGTSLPPMTAAPGVLALQRAMVWLVGASGAIVFIEPSPYEIATLLATLLFFATGLRLRLVFMPLLLALFLLNVGYTISAVAVASPATRRVRPRASVASRAARCAASAPTRTWPSTTRIRRR